MRKQESVELETGSPPSASSFPFLRIWVTPRSTPRSRNTRMSRVNRIDVASAVVGIGEPANPTLYPSLGLADINEVAMPPFELVHFDPQ